MDKYKKNNINHTSKYIKYWISGLLIISLIYMVYIYYEYGFFTPSFCDDKKKEYLRSITHAYPPPLVNFMDPPNIFNHMYQTN
jgi:hypothetical protein